uniref:Putative AC transposase n=2 Tax=Noccaea caerulescens TaxID=107243 RepID=A0A1J3IT19_NOCCA
MASCDSHDMEEDDGQTPIPPPSSRNKGKRKDKTTETASGSEPSGNKKKKKIERSWVWQHFPRHEDNYDLANCLYCKKEFNVPTSNGTTNMKTHLQTCKSFKVWEAANKFTDQTVLTPTGTDGTVSLGKVSDAVVKEATNEMIVLAQLPLAFIESIAWRHFTSKVKLPTPVCRKTSTKEIVKMYADRKARMKTILGKNNQRLSLTTDIWVAPYTAASYMVITAHFVDANFQLKKMIIGFKSVSDHKGGTIAGVLLDCLDEWEIKKIFCITVDNATANTSALRKFKAGFLQKHGKDALVLNGEFLHLRCATHILNLIVKQGLMEVDDNINAIRNGIQYVRSSTPRLQSFEFRVETGKMTRGSLPLDVKTRWNSTYLMLDQALKFRLAFDKMRTNEMPYLDYFKETVEGKVRIGPPTDCDWEAVDRLVQFLHIFYESTLILSASKSVAAHKIYNEIVNITRNISLVGDNSGDDNELKYKALSMLGKLKKYWNPFREATDRGKEKNCQMNKLLIVASVFDPRKKMKFALMCFEKLYGKDSLEYGILHESILDIMKRLFDEYSASVRTTSSSSGTVNSQSQGVSSTQSQDQVRSEAFSKRTFANGVGYERMDNLFEELVQQSGIEESSNEVDLYLKESLENPKLMKGTEYDILSWWMRNSLKFPILSLVARDILAIQVSSVALESAFSTSGRMLDPHRSCLTHYMIEVLMCTEQWLKCEIHFNEKGVSTIEQMLSDVELQDDLMREFEPEFHL